MSHVLTVDVGNSRAKFGIFEPDDSALPHVVTVFAVPLDASRVLSEELSDWIKTQQHGIATAVVAGSNPPVRDRLLRSWPENLVSPQVVTSAHQVPVVAEVDNPTAVGIDRLLTAFAAWQILSAKKTAVVVDSGTATTINLITADGVFRGGTILPGLRLSARALHEYTARLPWLDTDQIADNITETEAPVPGRNTEQAIRSGLFWGQLGAIREIRTRLERSARENFGAAEDVACFVTGGGGKQLSDHLAPCRFVDCLALHGLAMLTKP